MTTDPTEAPVDSPPPPETLSLDEQTRVRAAIARLRASLELPDDDGAVRLLPLALVAWADGVIQEAETEKIREVATRAGLADRWAVVERLLRARQGPFFKHRVLHLIQACRLDGRLDDDVSESTGAAAREVAVASGGFLHFFGRISPEEEALLDEVDRALALRADALKQLLGERRTLPIVPEWLDPSAAPRKEVHVHRSHDAIVQVVALHLRVHRTPERPWAPVIVTLDPLENASELDAREVRRAWEEHAHRPEHERWAVLNGLISAVARPIDPVFRAELLAEARSAGATGEDFVLVDAAEMFEVQHELARSVGWVAWHAGKLEEVLVDHEVVRRRLAPGTFDAPRSEVTARLEPPFAPSELPGLRFKRLVIEAPKRAPLRVAAPEIAIGTDAAFAWVAKSLPVLRDPYTTLLLDVRDDKAHWTVDVRSSLPGEFDGHAEPLPSGRSLVVPPWIWDRIAAAFRLA